MNLPNRENAYISPEKLIDYLLSESHPVGGPKARYLRASGFNETNIALLHDGLIGIAHLYEVQNSLSIPYGEKFVIDGEILAPNGSFIFLRTVWIIDKGQDRPRFVTAYPE